MPVAVRVLHLGAFEPIISVFLFAYFSVPRIQFRYAASFPPRDRVESKSFHSPSVLKVLAVHTDAMDTSMRLRHNHS